MERDVDYHTFGNSHHGGDEMEMIRNKRERGNDMSESTDLVC
jgi:hypothetical protein